MGKMYEDAPAVELVATTCCVCGRPLLDAPSLKSGIGPICAEKTGYGREDLPAGVRDEVNRLVYELAKYGKDKRAIERLMRLRELGFDQLVARVEERLQELVEIRTFPIPSSVPPRVYAEFPEAETDQRFNAVRMAIKEIPGRRWETVLISGKRERRWTFPRTKESFIAFRSMLAQLFPGCVVQGLKGLYVVQSVGDDERGK